jgi:hypothetical protein
MKSQTFCLKAHSKLMLKKPKTTSFLYYFCRAFKIGLMSYINKFSQYIPLPCHLMLNHDFVSN